MYKIQTKIDINIKPDVFDKMFMYAHYAVKHFDSEVAGWGHYTLDKGIYKLAPLCEQTASTAEVEGFPDDILEMPDYDISDMCVQWHSHGRLGVMWSKTDEDNIADTLELTGFLISIVVNIKGEYKARVDYISHLDQVDIEEHISMKANIKRSYKNRGIEREILKKISEPVIPVPIPASAYNTYDKYSTYRQYYPDQFHADTNAKKDDSSKDDKFDPMDWRWGS